MKAEILSIGTEILLGEIVDTNAAWIAKRLPAIGIDLYYKSVIGDNFDRLRETIAPCQKQWVRTHATIERAAQELEHVYCRYVRTRPAIQAA